MGMNRCGCGIATEIFPPETGVPHLRTDITSRPGLQTSANLFACGWCLGPAEHRRCFSLFTTVAAIWVWRVDRVSCACVSNRDVGRVSAFLLCLFAPFVAQCSPERHRWRSCTGGADLSFIIHCGSSHHKCYAKLPVKWVVWSPPLQTSSAVFVWRLELEFLDVRITLPVATVGYSESHVLAGL